MLLKINSYEEGISFATQVASGKITANRYLVKGCQRFLDYLEKKDWRWQFDPERAQHIITFYNQLKLSKGPDAGKPFILQAFQVYLLCAVFGFVDKNDPWNRMVRNAMMFAPRKIGKALCLQTPIPTPSGWTTMGEIKVNDVVFNHEGKMVRVLFKSEIFENHECFEVCFSNGEVIIADAEHLWLVNDRYKEKAVIATTKDLVDRVILSKRADRLEHNLSVDMPDPLLMEKQKLPIPSYTFGAWLGDGFSDRPFLTCNIVEKDHFASQFDAEGVFWHEVKDNKESTTTFSFSDRYNNKDVFNQKLKNLGVHGDKHIPDIYLRSSKEQRMALLQGLMDTDGHIIANGNTLEFCTVYPLLAKTFGELLSTMGIKWTMKSKYPIANGKRIDKLAYVFTFACYKNEIPCFRLPRKLERQRKNPNRKTRCKTVQITSIKPIASVKTACIGVQGELFLAGKTMLPTHNSEFAAGLALYFLWFGEVGTQCISVARDRAQASLIFDTAKTFIRTAPSWLSREYNSKIYDISCRKTGGIYKTMSREASRGSGDGLNVELLLADESSQLPRELIEVMESGMVARKSPLLFHTTTASHMKLTKFHENLMYTKNILDGIAEDNPAFFALIYELDPDMDWKDPKTWPIVNPMFGISVFPEAIEQRVKEAQAKPSMINEVLTKTFNLFVSSESSWIDTKYWEESPKGPKPDAPESTFISFDLSLTRDLCCVCVLDRYDMESYYATFQFFLPEESIDFIPLHEQGVFRDAIARGSLKLTEGNVADYRVVEEYILKICHEKSVKKIGYDAWNATAVVANLYEKGLPLQKIGQGMSALSAASKQTEKLIYEKLIAHDHDPMMLFQLQNATRYEDVNLNLKVKRPEGSPHAKIDGVVSLIMGVHLSLEDPLFGGFFIRTL